MNLRHYKYVGPAEIVLNRSADSKAAAVESHQQLTNWLAVNLSDADPAGNLTATFIIDCSGLLRLAPRRSEHVACAGGGPVRSAGEITFTTSGDGVEVTVIEVTNQSTGYCPEPESWPAVATALDRIGVWHPGVYTCEIVFRRCEACGERTIVKDDWFVCELCGGDLPRQWNFGSTE